MAFSVKFSGILKENKSIDFEIEIPWWNCNELKKDPRFTESNDTGSYYDYDADFSLKEMIELHENNRKKASSGIYE